MTNNSEKVLSCVVGVAAVATCAVAVTVLAVKKVQYLPAVLGSLCITGLIKAYQKGKEVSMSMKDVQKEEI